MLRRCRLARNTLFALVVGDRWAAHPLWDVGLHLLGGGRDFAPAWYAIACISFDGVVALYLAFRCGRRRSDLAGYATQDSVISRR